MQAVKNKTGVSMFLSVHGSIYVNDATVSRLHGWVDTGMAVVWIADRFKETRGVGQ